MMKKLQLVLVILAAQLLPAQKAQQLSLVEQSKIDKLQIEELTRQVDYYKKTLNFSKAIRSANFENMKFTINDVRGLKKDGTVMIEFSYTNMSKDLHESLQFEKAVLVDSQGKQYNTSQVFLTSDGKIRVIDLVDGIPYKGALFFKKSSNYFPIIRALILYAYPKDQLSNPEPVVFENLPVIWE